MSVYYLVFLECFKLAEGATGMVADLIIIGYLRVFLLDHGSCLAINEVDFVSVNDAMVLTLYSEVVGDEFNRSFGRGCHP